MATDSTLPTSPISSFGQLLSEHHISQRALARACGMSTSAMHRLVRLGHWPARDAEATAQRITQWLVAQGVDAEGIRHALPSIDTPHSPDVCIYKEYDMLLQAHPLSDKARQHFRLPRNPFIDDVQSLDDVYKNPSIRYARAALMDAARNAGFMALVGESGAGKSTLVDELSEQVRLSHPEIILIKPFVLAMEANDQRGKTLKAAQIAESIIHTLDPSASIKRSPEGRFRQLTNLLRDSRRAGNRHLLVIEEAHCLPHATLKHLKRFVELKDGLQRLLGVALIAQPELDRTLSSMNAEIREVAQRCVVYHLDPLDSDVQDYLQHKFARFGLQYADVFADDAADAIRTRLVVRDRNSRSITSVCHPLAIQNLVCRAMNVAAEVGWPRVDAQAIAGC